MLITPSYSVKHEMLKRKKTVEVNENVILVSKE